MVFVQSIRDKKLMPCTEAKARHLLKAKRAICIRREPFTIKLRFKCENKTQSITLGIDAGAKHIGLSASTEKKELFAADVELRTDVTKLISTRRELRRARRNRKTRYRKPRFNNRIHAKKENWLAPTILNRVEAHLQMVKKLTSVLPITKIIVETASFDIQKIKNPNISGEEYQHGEQAGNWNVREYVLFRDNHECQYCHGKSGDKILNVHHLESRKTGGNAPNNLITLCKTCHETYHKGKIQLKQKRGQSFRAAAFMGIMRWAFFNKLKKIYQDIEVHNTFGYLTKNTRIRAGLSKEHYIDAYCIAGNMNAKRLHDYWYIKQTRRHNRQIHKTIPKKGIRKRNQAPYLVHGFRLFDKVRFKGLTGFIFGRRSSGSFDIRKLDRTKISACANYKKLVLVRTRKTYLMERRVRDSSHD